mgnify:CR=1 FL=1
MKKEHWINPESNLIVEKYSKVINREHLDQLDGRLYNEMDKGRPLLHLADFTDATFFNLDYGEMADIFNDFLNRLGDNVGTKVAFYSGNNDKDDLMKVSAFSKYETSKVQLKSFVELIDAVKWLELTQEDRQEIWKKLQ